ncbi:MAG TPA: hypothetical protein VHB77_05270, partial [Planctomycetaceae bacterium]|nr:hypothetical protein [Planctomycetaceae bacterium]
MSPGSRCAPLRREDIPELSQFLISGFGVPADSPYFSPEVLEWKYFDGPGDRPTHSGESACSLVSRAGGKIIGHVGMCLREFIVAGHEAPPVSTMHAIDWLGSPTHPGTGVTLMLEAFKATQTQFAVDG